ncbi:hypothetical protein [Archangium sp.]|uniref:hypothetical protein n=1 Tax=Archangium sp. TaxID=1872627 RepID=UPI002D7602C5|nr:hypothetical protein [Archangium sp.]HYO59848.1 hypothetical protein [Archangium sp.]
MAKNQSVRYVPPEEAAWYRFKHPLPEQGRQTLPGSISIAIRLAMEHFLPRNTSAPPGADAVDICIRQRQPWDVEAAPWKEGVTLVRFVLGPGACQWGGAPLLDMGATYAVDVHNGRIVSSQSPLTPPEEAARFQFPPDLPRQNLRHIEGNMAAAIELAMDDFLALKASATAGASLEQECLSRLTAYDVTVVPESEGVMLVRFDVNDEVCPPPGTPDIVEGQKVLSPAFITTYAIDIRTMRILGINLTTRQRIVE